mmetsp:Transcript_26553/g.74206  ORF Transcript_26553/g.74206 Transcript_26553/m.74206 type:complete len:507 (+) Transcript_26553:89-1609(+)|eukprot:CAMPEP_0119127244 /NCGR_PEP_ID=MMETSP1310-20130426/5869_1 /TAXON_ID=464262 /ORGANISM="Genus nov. species nov., Strain RCC2339" /LENGTH=506 /DNA_ID=CAMNT_0007117489 /DNA_START=30 /DNA_END=1550 /DNA_ORIENTATION=-
MAYNVNEDVAVLRRSFREGKTRSREWRLGQLEAFKRMMTEGLQKFSKALWDDLHKSAAESYFTEINVVEHEIQHMINNLDVYMAPKKVGTDVMNVPGWSYIYKDPLGVVAVIGAWNYPVHLTLACLAGAIAAGNCALVKVPSSKYSTQASRVMEELAAQYLDRDCIRFVGGDRNETQAVLGERFDLIFFTGGAFVGKMVAEAAAKNLTPTVLELGGKSPCIVDKTADLRVAALRITWATFLNSGQTCLRPDYLLVHEDVAEALYAELERAKEEMYSKDPKQTEFFGRVINERAHKRLSALIDSCRPDIRFGGETDASQKYVAPTLVDYGTDEARFAASEVMQDEIFGPILPALKYKSLDQVIDFVSGREKPLALYFFTTDAAARERVLRETTSGVCNINDCMMNMTNPELPFGGVGRSGMGSYHGEASFLTFSHKKSVLVKTNWLDVPLRYPPYTPNSVRALSMIATARPRWQALTLKFGGVALLCYVLIKLPIFQLVTDIMQARL